MTSVLEGAEEVHESVRVDAYQEVDSPAVLVDLDILDRNLAAMARRASETDTRLRPHTKTHKSSWISQRQLEFGASGITVAKLGEAEVMADAGIDDILVAYPIVGVIKLERLARLAQQVRVAVSLDSVEVAAGVATAGRRSGRDIDVLVEIDSGHHRCGLRPGAPGGETTCRIADLQGVRVRGLITHAGHAYRAADAAELRQIALAEATSLVETSHELEKRGMTVPELSLGSTATAWFIADVRRAYPEITEFRPGTYVFHDVNQMTIGVATEEDCALTVLATVVSQPAPDRIVVDAGSKTLGGETGLAPGYGRVRGDPSARVIMLSEEHATIRVPMASRWQVGDRLELIPNHACAVPNLADELLGVRGGAVERRIPVDARGKNR